VKEYLYKKDYLLGLQMNRNL